MAKLKSVIEAFLPLDEIKNIDKRRTFSKEGKDFLPIKISIFDRPDKYGRDAVVNLQQNKEEIEAKKYTKLCNAKTVYPKPQNSDEGENQRSRDFNPAAPDDDLPF